ncbi:MAG TPA: GNAT family N-acetyltransferase [Phycisphaerae bacterium]|nr:GNAT family N-acetyltransferase [Phycisphaerae bacterium]HUT58558.1 GNAT family N-acetyltransferase [Phycisphaerae bacterium]
MDFVNLTPSTAGSWDELVARSDDGWLYTLSSWQRAITGIPEWGLEDRSFALMEKGRMLAVMPLQVTPAGTLASTGFGSGGPAVAPDVPAGHRKKLLRSVFEHVRRIADQTHAASLEVSVSPLSRSSLGNVRGVNFLVDHGFEDASTHCMIADLSRSEGDLWSDLERNARTRIRRARKAGYTVERADWPEMLEAYYRIHHETYERTGAAPHPRAYFQAVAGELAAAGHAVLWVGRDPDGKPVAFHNCARFKDTSQYWTGCCRTDRLNTGVNYLLFWHALLGAKEDGCRWYEIGETFPNAAGGKLHTLTIFKTLFGGEQYRFYKGRMDLGNGRQAVSRPSFRPLVRNWLRASRDLMVPVFGQRVVAAASRAIRFPHRLCRSVVPAWRGGQPQQTIAIPFIKPYWSETERRIGLEDGPIDGDEAADAFKIAGRTGLGISEDELIVPTGSGRAALELALRVLKRQFPGRDKVLLPTYGCRGTIDPVLRSGLTPVLVDIDMDMLPDAREYARRLSSEVLACLLVHLGGKRMKTDEVIRKARRLGVVVIEDHCQNVGNANGGPRGDMSIYSFGIGKNIMASAGGALVTGILHEQVEEAGGRLRREPVRMARDRFGAWYCQFMAAGEAERDELRKRYRIPRRANQNQFRRVAMNGLDAAIVVEQLGKLGQIIERRKANAARTTAELRRFPQTFSSASPEGHIYTKLSVRLPSQQLRDEFIAFMAARGVELEKMYVPLHLRSFARRFRREPLKVSESLYSSVVNVPVRPNLSSSEVERITESVGAFGRAHAHG